MCWHVYCRVPSLNERQLLWQELKFSWAMPKEVCHERGKILNTEQQGGINTVRAVDWFRGFRFFNMSVQNMKGKPLTLCLMFDFILLYTQYNQIVKKIYIYTHGILKFTTWHVTLCSRWIAQISILKANSVILLTSNRNQFQSFTDSITSPLLLQIKTLYL